MRLRTDLRPRTREPYGGLLQRHLGPAFGPVELSKISPSQVRAWFSDLSGGGGPGQATGARCYRLLRTIMNTAVTDGLVVKNPCQVKGAGTERSPERPIASIPEVQALAAAIAPRFRAAVLLAAFCSLRRGEILGLRRGDVDLLYGTVTVRRAVVSLADGTLLIGDRKTAAGRRTVAVPRVIVPALQDHLDELVECPSEAPLFLGEKGRPPSPARPPSGMGSDSAGDRPWSPPFSRPAPQREHLGSGDRCQYSRAHGPHGPRKCGGSPPLPARHR